MARQHSKVSIPTEMYKSLEKEAIERGYGSVAEFVQFYMRLVLRGDIE
jgi:hypothetical protein